MSIGYEVQVTPLQIAQAYAAFANKGKMMRPYIVDKVVNSEGSTVWQQDQVTVRQIAKEKTIDKLYPVFQRVVSDSGTADLAQVKGLSIAGKTGTAQKLVNGRYTNSYRSSFVGFFPANDPKYVALVILDNPDTYPPYGGHTAGPIFQQAANRIAGLDNDIEKQILDREIDTETWAMAPNLMGLTKEEATTLLNKQDIPFNIEGSGDWIADQSPNAGTGLSPTDQITLQLSNQTAEVDTTELPDGYSIIPDVGGMSMRNASRLITGRGYDVKRIGSGTVYTQFPRPGDQMQKGRTITIRGKAKSLNNIVSK
jgi:cell division protein FtsI (penicillin-binding protein 3)